MPRCKAKHTNQRISLFSLRALMGLQGSPPLPLHVLLRAAGYTLFQLFITAERKLTSHLNQPKKNLFLLIFIACLDKKTKHKTQSLNLFAMSQRVLIALTTPAARICILSFPVLSSHSDGWATFPPRWWVLLLEAVSVSVTSLDICRRIGLFCLYLFKIRKRLLSYAQ